MMIYFKSGETLHIAGKEGERVKNLVAKWLREPLENSLVVVVDEDRVDEVQLILNIEEIAAIR